MNVAGDFDLFADAFPTDLLPSVFTVILEEWPRSPRPADVPRENRITNRFVGHLQSVMRTKTLPSFHFDYRPKLADDESDSESGELDICVRSFAQHPDAFFVFECKRLNVNYDSGFKNEAPNYIGAEGMGCFVSGQYPATCTCGGMLGYVMDGNVPTAIKAVKKALSDNRQQLLLRPPHELAQAQIMPNENRVYQTIHEVNHTDLLIYHLFLAY